MALRVLTSPEHRFRNRRRMIKMAEIVVDGGPIPCIVLDVSLTGAHLYLTADTQIPQTVILRLPDDVVRTAHLRWQHEADLGFEFVEP